MQTSISNLCYGLQQLAPTGTDASNKPNHFDVVGKVALVHVQLIK
jgi:hypothetical protein